MRMLSQVSRPPSLLSKIYNYCCRRIKDYSIDGENLNATNNQIAGVIKEIMNNSMVQFIQAKYLEIPKANGGLKQILIDLLAQYKTQLSYDVLRELLSTYCLLQLSAHLQD